MFSAASSTAASSESASLATFPSSNETLLLEVGQLGNPSHPLTVAVSQLKGAEVAETWVERFIPPAQLVGAVNRQELKAQVLTQESPLFLPIYQLMQEARVSLMPQLVHKDPLQQIFQIYEGFISEVCAAQGKERSRLLKGDLLTTDRSLFSKLIYAQRWTELEALIESGFNCTSEQLGQDFLHHLAEQPFPEAIFFLINHGYPTDLRNSRGQTPLHLAAQAGQIVNFAPLLSQDSESINDRDMEGRTPLLLAVIQGHQDAVEKLLELKANPFLTSKEKENALHYAAFYGHSALLNVLLQTDLKAVIDAGDSDGKTPLHRAVWLNPKPEVVHLLLNAGATVDQQNLFGYTPLHWAAKHGHLASAKMLLERGADFTTENQNGHTPLDMAVRFGQDLIVRLFLNPEAAEVLDNTSSAVAATSDPEGGLYGQFEEAYYANRPFDQIVALEKLADIFLQKENFVITSHLLNSALAVAQKWNINPHYQHYLFHRLERLEGRFLEKTFGVKTPASHRNYLVPYRDRLKALREEVCRRLELNQEPIETTLEFLTQGFNRLLCDLIDESLRLINKPPPTSFAIITLGSLARHEPSLYSDVEFAILTAEDSLAIKTFFRDFSVFLALKISNFGETKFEIVRSRCVEGVKQKAQSLTPNGFSMDIGGLSPLGKTGVYELIATPIQMASFQDPSWLQRHDGELILVNALSCASHLYGDEALVTAYREEMNRYLDVKTDTILRFFGGTKEREKRAISILQGHVSEFRPYLEIDRLEMRAFEAKKDLYRPIQMAVHALMLYHGINRQSTLQGIEALREREIISTEGAINLTSALRQALQLRLKAHAYYQTEKEILYFSRGTEDIEGLGLFHINQPTLILELYRVLTPLHSEMMEFVRNTKRTLQTNPFYDTTFGTLNTQAEKELNYWVAASSYVQAAALNPEDEVALGRLGSIKWQLGEARESIKHHQEELRILREKHGDKPHLAVATSLNNLGVAYNDLGETVWAIEYHEQSLAMKKFIYEDKSHSDVATSLNNLGLAYQSLGKTARAIDYYEQSLAIRKLIYGDKPHPDVATSLNNLGLTYQSLGKTARAIDYYEQSLAMKKLIYGDKPHPDVAVSLNNLGGVYGNLGETARAIDYHEQSLAIFKHIYGDKPHPSVATSLNNLGGVYGDLGETVRAIDYYEQSLAMRKLIYEDKPHSDVATSLNNLGSAYLSLGETNRAIEYYEQSLAMRKLIYGDKPHLSVAKSLRNLALAYNKLGETIRAIDYHEQLLAMRKLIYEDKPHSDVATSLNNLGGLYKGLGETARAIDYYEQSLMMFKLIYGDKPHSDVATSLNNLGSAYKTLGETARAIEYYEESLAMRKLIYKDKLHLDVATSLNNLGLAYRSLGETALTIEYHGESLAMKKLIYGDKPHPSVATSLNNLGTAYKDLGEIARAINYYEQSLGMRKLIYGDKPHPDVANSLNNLGSVYKTLGETARAIEYYEESVAIYKLIYGDKPHPSVATSLNNLGHAYRALKDPIRASEYFLEVVHLYRQLYNNKSHLKVAESLNFLGAAYREAGNFDQSVDLCMQALEMKIALYGDVPHEEIAFTLGSLGKVYEKLIDYPKAHEVYQKAYTISQTLKGDDHKKTKEALTDLQRVEAALAAQV